MELTQLKNKILENRIQQLEVKETGEILASDNVLFKIEKGDTLANLHPFLEATQYLLSDLIHELTFPCVNLEIRGTKKIVDVEIHHTNGTYHILLLDFTAHYEASHPLVQEKNESSIAKNKLDFEKRLLQAKEEFKNNFLANLNHEIRNPLNNMLGFIDLLSETKLNYEQYEMVKVVKKTGGHIKMLMDDMLDISKIERGVITLKHVNFYLSSLVASLQQHFVLKYNSQEVTLEVTIQEGMHKTFIGDPIRLNQILFNLLENAFRNTKKGTVRLDISAENKNAKTNWVQFTVSDTGSGIPDNQLPHIFESYYQLKLNDEKPIGEGLGLKIVKDLVDLLQGSISVHAGEKEGSVFICKIPFEKRAPKREKKTVKKGSGIFQSRKILIVENEPTNQMLLMKTFLNNDNGYVIEIANNAAQAFSLLEERNYNLVVLKNELPDSNAVEFLEKMESHPEDMVSRLPTLVASGSTMIEQQQAFLNAGASAFLAKPYTKKELFKTIEKLIR